MNRYSSLRVAAALVLGTILCSVSPAAAQTSSQSIPLTMNVFIPCANNGDGEIVEMTGTLHILTHTSTDANGCVTMKSHFQPQGLSGVGSVTGAKYQGTGVTQSTTRMTTACDGCTIEENYSNNFRMIGQGPGNNFMVHMNSRVIINFCTGEYTVVSSNSSVECF